MKKLLRIFDALDARRGKAVFVRKEVQGHIFTIRFAILCLVRRCKALRLVTPKSRNERAAWYHYHEEFESKCYLLQRSTSVCMMRHSELLRQFTQEEARWCMYYAPFLAKKSKNDACYAGASISQSVIRRYWNLPEICHLSTCDAVFILRHVCF